MAQQQDGPPSTPPPAGRPAAISHPALKSGSQRAMATESALDGKGRPRQKPDNILPGGPATCILFFRNSPSALDANEERRMKRCEAK